MIYPTIPAVPSLTTGPGVIATILLHMEKSGLLSWRIKPRTLLLWVRQGKMKAFALSGTKRRVWRFRQMDLDAALLESSVLPSIPPFVRPAERMGQ